MLKVVDLRKKFDTVVAVDGVSLEVKRGELFGLLGPNGAGKTTTIRTVLNIIKPDSGTITFDDKPFTEEMWNIIGYLPEERGLYKKSKIINAILYFASLKGLSVKEAKNLAYYWLERFDLKYYAHRKIEELSKGNQQKIQFIISILHHPQLLILDEPFSGLDPVNQILMKDILLELRQNNVAIIFSTHQMEQVEKLCDNICLINKGKPVLGGELHKIKSQYGKNFIHLEYDGDGEYLKKLSFVKNADIYQNYAELELTDISKSNELLSNLLDGKIKLKKFEIVEPSLQSIFIDVVGGVEDIEKASEKPIPKLDSKPLNYSKLAMKDKRVRQAFLSFILIFCTSILSSFSVFYDNSSPYIAFLFLGLTIFAAIRFFYVRKKVENELAVKNSERGMNDEA